ncbi:MAG TPA: FecR domain-containing protein [Methylovirgula sp.]
MTDPTDNSGTDPLLNKALDWIALLKGGEPARTDIEALQRWRAESPAHEEAFRRAVEIWRNLSAASEELAAQERVVPARPFRRVSTRRAVIGGALAASAAGYMAVRPPLDLWPSLKELSADYRTGKGEQRVVALAENVSLKLNTLTSIVVRSTPKEPRIELISGEVAVDARLAGKAPLVVFAATGRATAENAAFNVRCIDGNVAVSCLRGIADVEAGGRSVEVAPDRQVSYASGLGPGIAVAIDPTLATAWQTGQLIFRDRSLSEVVGEVNRYRPGMIIITNSDLARRLVNGTFQISELGNFVAQVEQLFGAKATSLPGGIVLLG